MLSDVDFFFFFFLNIKKLEILSDWNDIKLEQAFLSI